jgi:NADP-dependent alcohol dehydrogenase
MKKIDGAIEKSRAFFESVGIKTRISDKSHIDEIIDNLKNHGQTAFSETGDMTLDDVRKILELAL